MIVFTFGRCSGCGAELPPPIAAAHQCAITPNWYANNAGAAQVNIIVTAGIAR